MAFPFSSKGRVAIPISSPDRAQCVASGIKQWLEGGRVRDVHWKDNVLHFTGDYFLRWDRLWNARRATCDGLGPSFLKFEDRPDQVVIDFTLNYRFTRYLLLIAAASVPMFVVSGWDPYLLLAIPVIALLHGGLWLLTGFDFKSDLRIAASRSMTKAAEQEMQAHQAAPKPPEKQRFK